MKPRNNLFLIGKFLLSGSLLVTLAGCASYVDGPSTGMYGEPPVIVAGSVIEDDFVYYPNYQVYYSNTRHQYAYQDGPNWVYRHKPRGVSINRLHASPSVNMDFHDSPAYHHQNVLQQYPKNWSPSHGEPGHSDGGHEDQHQQPGENRRR